MAQSFEFMGTDHIHLIVGNAKQAAYFYQSQFGFELKAYSGLETGDREKASYMLQQNKIRIVLSTPYKADSDLNKHLSLHGDGVKDVAFWTDNTEAAWKHVTEKGAKSVMKPTVLKDDFGEVIMATIQTYGDTVHSFVQRDNYSGAFLPGFEPRKSILKVEPIGLNFVDHFVGNQPENEMQKVASWYEEVFGWKRFWTVDDKDVATEYTSLRSIVVANDNERLKMPINRPAAGLRKSQIEEFVEYYSGPGIQHIALDTKDIVETVSKLKANGVEFLEVPQSYYDELPDRVGDIDEDISELAELGVLVDRDQFGYLLQLFTKPVQDRPTLFYEIIQRKGCTGFGKGNFKALFESIEREQERRGNL
jgi:4-hydroxyphenylpyruvate dioxygenase